MNRFIALISTLLVCFNTTLYAQTKWTPTLSTVSFTIKNFGINVDGSFKGFQGTLVFDPDNLSSSSLSAAIGAATIDTDNERRDEHLRSEDYFYVEKYPNIQMSSNSLYRTQEAFAGEFDITIRGITKKVKIPFNFTMNGERAVFESRFTINRRDFEVGGGSLVLSDDVEVSIVVNAKK